MANRLWQPLIAGMSVLTCNVRVNPTIIYTVGKDVSYYSTYNTMFMLIHNVSHHVSIAHEDVLFLFT